MAGESGEDKVRSYLEINSSKHLNCSAGVGREGGKEGKEREGREPMMEREGREEREGMEGKRSK